MHQLEGSPEAFGFMKIFPKSYFESFAWRPLLAWTGIKLLQLRCSKYSLFFPPVLFSGG